jgi:DNA helicase-4
LLSRTKSLPGFISNAGGQKGPNTSDHFLTQIRSYLPEEDRSRVSISTVHKFKGLQSTTVIILDASEQKFPLVHPDIIYTRIFGDTPAKTIEEERRLFYVALTRAKKSLYIFTDTGAISPFLLDIDSHLSIIDWEKYPEPIEAGPGKRIFVLVGNTPEGGKSPTFSIKDSLKELDFKWNSSGWPCWHRSYSSNNFEPEQFISNTPVLRDTEGIEVRFQDSGDTLVAKCQVIAGKLKWIIGNE